MTDCSGARGATARPTSPSAAPGGPARGLARPGRRARARAARHLDRDRGRGGVGRRPGPQQGLAPAGGGRARPRTSRPPSLLRARSAAAAASSAIAIQVARSSRPRASTRPRQSSSGASPAQPIATSAWPWRHARPNESVTTTASPPPGLAQRARRARARGVGVAGEEHERLVVGRVGGVDAGVGAHEAVVGAADQHPALGAHELGGLVEDDLDRARVLAVLGRQRLRPLVGRRRRPGDDAALGLRDDLVRDHEHVAVAQTSAGGGDISAARSSPARTSGSRRERGRGDGAGAQPTRRRAPQVGQGGAGVAGKLPGRARGRPRAPRDRRACRRRARARTGGSTAGVMPESSASRRWRRGCLAEARRDHVRRRQQQPVGAGAVAVGHDRDAGEASWRRSSPSTSCGHSAGSRRAPAAPVGLRALGPRDAERGRRRLARLGRVVDHEVAARGRQGRAPTPRR